MFGVNFLLFLQTLDRVGKVVANTWASRWAKSIHTNTPRCLNYLRSGVQDWRTKKAHKGTPPPQPQLATGYVEAGAKLREGLGE